MGLCAIGRPNASGGAEILDQLLAEWEALKGRELIVLVENDRKPDGSWPGREGSLTFMEHMTARGHTVRLAYTPDGAKDVREWFSRPEHRGVPLAELGRRFARAARELVEVHRPQAPVQAPVLAPVPTAPVHCHGGDGCSHGHDQGDQFAGLAEAIRQYAGNAPRSETEAAQFVARNRADLERFPCNDTTILFFCYRRDGSPVTVERRCQRWDCPGCRDWLIVRELENAALRIGQAEQVYELGCTPEQWRTVHQRINRAEGDYHRLRDGEGYYTVTSVPVEGAILTTKATALDTIETLLNAHTGCKRPVSTSHGWRAARTRDHGRDGVAGRDPANRPPARHGRRRRGRRCRNGPDGGWRGRRPVHRAYRFVRPGGWDEATFDAFAGHLMAGEVIPDADFDWLPAAPRETTLEEDFALC
jgi:hypothetical protein